jgi:hypothetical protein
MHVALKLQDDVRSGLAVLVDFAVEISIHNKLQLLVSIVD